jgi:hypothetical protein
MPDRNAILEEIINLAQEDESFQSIARDYQSYAALQNTPAWVKLNSHLERVLNSFERNLVQQIMSGAEVDQRRIDYVRGFIIGARSVLSLPGRIEERFERATDQAWDRAVRAYGERKQEEVDA